MEEKPSDRCGGTNLKSPKVEAFQPKVYETMSPPMAHRRESQAWCSGVDGPLVGLFRKAIGPTMVHICNNGIVDGLQKEVK